MGRPPNRTSAAFACPIGAERVSRVTRSSCPINPGAVMTWCSADDFWPWVRRILTIFSHGLIDFSGFCGGSDQKGDQKQEGWKPAKSRSFLQRFGRSKRNSFLITNTDNALCCRTLAKPDAEQPLSHRYKLSICYWRSSIRFERFHLFQASGFAGGH